MIGDVAARLAGSADIYQSSGHLPVNSVNFITAHDGFTLNDLVSYDSKHNHANGEGNRDGVDDNMSWNCGWEGETSDAGIEALRERQIRNFLTLQMVSQGVPMIVMGDEIRRTQYGNNNAYCQDNELTWFDWSRLDAQSGMHRFFSRMMAFRRSHPAIHRSRFFDGTSNERGLPDIGWHGVGLDAPGWDDTQARVLGMTLAGSGADADIHVMTNMYWDALPMEIPACNGRTWHRVVDTALPSPEDIADPGAEIAIDGSTYLVSGRSVVVLISK